MEGRGRAADILKDDQRSVDTSDGVVADSWPHRVRRRFPWVAHDGKREIKRGGAAAAAVETVYAICSVSIDSKLEASSGSNLGMERRRAEAGWEGRLRGSRVERDEANEAIAFSGTKALRGPRTRQAGPPHLTVL